MMKKRVLIPLLVAGMMVASIVSLDSCKKEQQQTSKAVFTDTKTPVTVNEIRDNEGGATYECPYCHQLLYHGDEHWHYFGTPNSMTPPYGDDPEGFNVSEMMDIDRPGGVPHFWGIAECLDGFETTLGGNNGAVCTYSGVLHDSLQAIQQVQYIYQHEFGIELSYDSANALLEPRFHAHRIYYRAIINGGQANTWHVGGGVPGWPGPHPENP